MNKKSSILVAIGIILISIALSLTMYNNYVNKKAEKKSQDAYQKIEEELNKTTTETNPKNMKVVTIDGHDYIGTIEIPVLNLKLPIMADWDNEKMKKSPCRYYGSIYTNNLVLCSHSYDNLFGNIEKLQPKDKIIIKDMNGNKYIYEVKLIEILSPKEVKNMIESDFDLTLYTCTKDNRNRVTVRLNKV